MSVRRLTVGRVITLPEESAALPHASARAIDADAAIDQEVLALFDECGGPLTRYAASFGLSPEAAQDVVQETFIALFRHLQLGRPRTHLRGWTFRVTHRLAMRHHRQRRRERQEPLDVSTPHRESADDPEQALALSRRQAKLSAVMQCLPDRDRQCLRLRAEGLPYREIGRIVGCSLGSVAKSLARSLARLARATGD